MSEITVGQYLFLEEWAPLAEALSSAPTLKIEGLEGNPQDVVTFLSGEKAVLLFVSLGSKDDLIALANLVKMSKKVLKDVPNKIIVVNFTGNRNIEKAILKMGILDILEEGIKPRALRFKIDFWVKSLAHTLKSRPANLTKKEVKAVESAQTEKRNDAPTWTAPIEEEADIWLVKNELEIKKILGRWLVKVMGPSPHVSSWVDVEGQRGVWKFQIKESHRDMFLPPEGAWFFRGENKPEYSWKEHLWVMAGDKIELFYQTGKVVTPRFFIQEKALQISKNSTFAKTKQQLILETQDQEHIFKKEETAPAEVQGIEGIDQLSSDLKGKGSTDNLGSGPLSGKTQSGADQLSDLNGKGSTDALDYGAMKGKNKNYGQESSPLEMALDPFSDSGPLKGKQQTDSLSSTYENETNKNSPLVEALDEDLYGGLLDKKKSPLQGATSTDKEDSFYEGKNKKSSGLFDDKNDDVTSSRPDKLDTKQEGAKGKSGYTGEELDKDGEDKEVEKYYKEHNEAVQYDAKDLSGKGSRADNLSGHMSSIINPKTGKPETEKEALDREIAAKKNNAHSRDNKKDEQRDIYHPSAKLDAFFAEEEALAPKQNKNQSTASSSQEGSTSSNVYPIRPRSEQEIDFDTDDEDEIPVDGEGTLSEISQTAKVYSFITQGSIKRLCDLDDFFDDMVILRVSGGDFMELQPVQLDLSFHYLKEKTPLKVAGVIEGVDADESNYSYVTIRLREEQVTQFEKFMDVYQKRQSHINQFMKRAKGF